MDTFIAVHDAPSGLDPSELKDMLERVARAADRAGVHPLESIYVPDAGEVISLVEAADAAAVADVHAEAGVACGRVGRASRVYTELLTSDRRDRVRSD